MAKLAPVSYFMWEKANPDPTLRECVRRYCEIARLVEQQRAKCRPVNPWHLCELLGLMREARRRR